MRGELAAGNVEVDDDDLEREAAAAEKKAAEKKASMAAGANDVLNSKATFNSTTARSIFDFVVGGEKPVTDAHMVRLCELTSSP